MPDSNDRRKNPRFAVGEGAFAFVNNIPFAISNVSAGGLQLRSLVYDEALPQEIFLDIFLKHENFYLQNLPVRLVRFQKQLPSSSFSSSQVRSFALQFGDLTEQQKTRLDFFIARSSTTAS